ncbi:hypothetical protein HanXRQr2_Chr13g0582991 [Helianthus annuus]|uniref:Uncharacterized protein n=1 Tax=Helianthus annuus TaxID=4232 RepID=A0A9K3H9R3_HELAN|nr:hypothetical protein HanXRQr2_Chr13g0582991 [Helianthus annuus]
MFPAWTVIVFQSLRGLIFSPYADIYLVLVPAWTCFSINLFVGIYLFKSPV